MSGSENSTQKSIRNLMMKVMMKAIIRAFLHTGSNKSKPREKMILIKAKKKNNRYQRKDLKN